MNIRIILLFVVSLALAMSPFKSYSQESGRPKSVSNYVLTVISCKEINHTTGERNVFGKITKTSTKESCGFSLFLSQENEKDPYKFECGGAITGQAYLAFIPGSGSVLWGSLNTKPRTEFRQKINCQ